MDWNKFENGELVVKATPTTVGSFLQACEERGLRWRSGDLPTEFLPGYFKGGYFTHNTYNPPLEGLGVSEDNNHDLPVIEWSNHENR